MNKKFGNLTAVNEVSLEIKKGEVIGLVGPNRAGKTTTLKLIGRLNRSNSVSVFIRNIDGELQDIYQNRNGLVEMGFLIDINYYYEQ